MSSASQYLLSLLVEAPDLDGLLDKVVSLATEVVAPTAASGLTMSGDGPPFSVATSNDLAAQVDEIQYGADQGPCLDALRSGKGVLVDDLAQDERWDRYRAHAVVHGVVSSLSQPLDVDGQAVGALNLYGSAPAAFTSEVRQHAEGFAESIVSHSIIDRAIGILMAQQRCTAITAFNLLRTASQNRNRKLRDVAETVIANVSGEPPLPRPGFTLPPEAGSATNRLA